MLTCRVDVCFQLNSNNKYNHETKHQRIMSIIQEISFEYISSCSSLLLKFRNLFCRHSTHVFHLFPKNLQRWLSFNLMPLSTFIAECMFFTEIFYSHLYLVIVFTENLFCFSTIYTSLKLYLIWNKDWRRRRRTSQKKIVKCLETHIMNHVDVVQLFFTCLRQFQLPVVGFASFSFILINVAGLTLARMWLWYFNFWWARWCLKRVFAIQ